VKRLTFGIVEGTRPKDTPLRSRMDDIATWAGIGVILHGAMMLVQDRGDWRKLAYGLYGQLTTG
jgi:hypothetical protein